MKRRLTHIRLTGQAHALFVGSYPRGSVFDIIHTTTDTEGSSQAPLYATHLVVYKAPSTAQRWELVFAVHDCKSVVEGLNYLLNLLRLQMGNQIRKLRSPYIQTQILTSSSILGREEEDKKKEDLAKLDQDLKEFRERWVPGR